MVTAQVHAQLTVLMTVSVPAHRLALKDVPTTVLALVQIHAVLHARQNVLTIAQAAAQ